MPDGTIWALGQIQANGFTNGNWDMLVMQVDLNGNTQVVENIGSTIIDMPAGMVYSQANDKMNLFGNTNSISFKN